MALIGVNVEEENHPTIPPHQQVIASILYSLPIIFDTHNFSSGNHSTDKISFSAFST